MTKLILNPKEMTSEDLHAQLAGILDEKRSELERQAEQDISGYDEIEYRNWRNKVTELDGAIGMLVLMKNSVEGQGDLSMVKGGKLRPSPWLDKSPWTGLCPRCNADLEFGDHSELGDYSFYICTNEDCGCQVNRASKPGE